MRFDEPVEFRIHFGKQPLVVFRYFWKKFFVFQNCKNVVFCTTSFNHIEIHPDSAFYVGYAAPSNPAPRRDFEKFFLQTLYVGVQVEHNNVLLYSVPFIIGEYFQVKHNRIRTYGVLIRHIYHCAVFRTRIDSILETHIVRLEHLFYIAPARSHN